MRHGGKPAAVARRLRETALGTEVDRRTPPGPRAESSDVDFLVVGSGSGMVGALAAHELGLRTLVIEKSEEVGGSTARSGGVLWAPMSEPLRRRGSLDTTERALTYMRALAGTNRAEDVVRAYIHHGPAVVDLLTRMTPLRFEAVTGYPDYSPEEPGGSATGRTIQPLPLDLTSELGEERWRLRGTGLPFPIPISIAFTDLRPVLTLWHTPLQAAAHAVPRLVQSYGGRLLGRDYQMLGQALMGGIFAGAIRARIPVWTRTALKELEVRDGRVVGVRAEQDGRAIRIGVRGGILLSAGGFEHDMPARRTLHSPAIGDHLSMGAETNTGDAIKAATAIGAQTSLMDQVWWLPAVAPLRRGDPVGSALGMMSLPGSFVVDRHGERFTNESADYMKFGQAVIARERAGDPVGDIWMVFDRDFRRSYILNGEVAYPLPIPRSWFRAGIAATGADPGELARAIGVPEARFEAALARFNTLAEAGIDEDFHRGASAYDHWYADPTQWPNPNLRPLRSGRLYAIRLVLSDIGTCGGLLTDGRARVLDTKGDPIPGLYASGNTAANIAGTKYPGPGATIFPGMVFGSLAARDAAGHDATEARRTAPPRSEPRPRRAG